MNSFSKNYHAVRISSCSQGERACLFSLNNKYNHLYKIFPFSQQLTINVVGNERSKLEVYFTLMNPQNVSVFRIFKTKK
jgi:hypothetical protein